MYNIQINWNKTYFVTLLIGDIWKEVMLFLKKIYL